MDTWKILGCVGAALLVGCSSSSGAGTGGGGGGGGSGGSGGSCTGVPTSPNACLGPGRDNCNPCSKITDAQASAAVGGIPLTAGSQNGDDCDWYQGTATNPTLIVTFNVGTDPRTFACDPANGFQFVSVSGVGDSACFIQEPLIYPPNHQWLLEFEKGCAVYDTYVVAGPGAPPVPDATEQSEAKALALDAVPNL